MTKRGTGSVVCVAGVAISLLAAGAAAAELEDAVRVRLRCPEVFVESFPMIVAVTIENTGERVRRIVLSEQTLASCGVEGVWVVFHLTRASGEELRVGSYGRGPFGDGVSVRRTLVLDAGERLSLVFDLGQLWLQSRPNQDRLLPWAGEWSITVRHTHFGVASEPCIVTIREATEDEQKSARELKPRKVRPRQHRWGSRYSWFPDVIIGGGGLPDASRLPIESRRSVELIRVLRSTAQSAQSGLEAIAGAEVGWGYLAPALDALEYECLLASERDTEASALRAAVLGEREDAAGHFLLVDKGGGLLARIEELKKKKAAREEFLRRVRGGKERKEEGGTTSKAGESATGLIAAGVLALVLCAGFVTWLMARRKGHGVRSRD